MKRVFWILLFVCFLIVNLNAEYTTAFQPGEKIAQAGFGFGMMGVYGDIVIPPISLSIDIAKEIIWEGSSCSDLFNPGAQ